MTDEQAAAPAGAQLVKFEVGDTGRPSSRARRAPLATASSGDGAPGSVVSFSLWWPPSGDPVISPGCPGEADLTLRLTPSDAQDVSQRRLEPSVAFMQGRMKTSGDNGLLLEVLRWTASASFAQGRAVLGLSAGVS